MQFSVQKTEFAKVLSRVQGAVDRKSAMPLLANLLLSATDDKLTVSATDLGVGIESVCGAMIKKRGAITVPAKSFYDIVKSLPDDLISIHVGDNNRLQIKSGRIEYKLVGASDFDYPKLPSTEGVDFSSLDASVIVDMIEKTIFSVSDDETRYHLAGVFLVHKADRIVMVSTDGHRLSMVSRPMEGGIGLTNSRGVIIPRKGLLEMKRLLDESSASPVEVGQRGSNVYLRRQGVMLSVKLVDAMFPDYENVLPKNVEKNVGVDRELLAKAVRRVSLMSSDKSHGVRFDFAKGNLKIASDNPDLGEAAEDVEIDYAGPSVAIGVNARYLLDVLDASKSAEVTIGLKSEHDPLMITPTEDKDYVCVIMPMRL